MPFSDYLAEQQKNLDQVTQLRIFKSLVPPIDVFYERSLALVAGHVGPYEAHLVICYKAFLSATSLIGRAQPEDALAITRRAIEAACLSRAIKHDPDNTSRWVADQDRAAGREIRLREAMTLPRSTPQRKGGRRFPKLPSVADPPDHNVVAYLRLLQGFLSDRAVHFTPEFLRTQMDPIKEEDGGEVVEVTMGWFERSQRTIEMELIALAVAHARILDLFDECFDGTLGRDEAWTLARTAIGMIARKLASDLGFDRAAEEFERRMSAEETESEGGDAS